MRARAACVLVQPRRYAPRHPCTARDYASCRRPNSFPTILSNPRGTHRPCGLANRRLEPLGHLSERELAGQAGLEPALSPLTASCSRQCCELPIDVGADSGDRTRDVDIGDVAFCLTEQHPRIDYAVRSLNSHEERDVHRNVERKMGFEPMKSSLEDSRSDQRGMVSTMPVELHPQISERMRPSRFHVLQNFTSLRALTL